MNRFTTRNTLLPQQRNRAVTKNIGATKRARNGRPVLTDISNQQGKTNSNNSNGKSSGKILRKVRSQQTSSLTTKSSFSLHKPVQVKVESKETAPKLTELDEVDLPSVGDPLACTEYILEIMHTMRQKETLRMPDANYLQRQPELDEEGRAVLIDWVFEVHWMSRISTEVLFLAVNIIDRYLSKRKLSPRSMQLLGCAACFIASKYEDGHNHMHSVPTYCVQEKISRHALRDMEAQVLEAIDFELCTHTAYRFMGRWLRMTNLESRAKWFAYYSIESSTLIYDMLKFRPSLIAASCLYYGMQQSTNTSDREWSPILEKHSGYKVCDMTECLKLLEHQIYNPYPNTGVLREKYASSKRGCVSTLTPRSPFPSSQ